jgi:hypothetical protein
MQIHCGGTALKDLPLELVRPHMNRKAYNTKLSTELAYDDHETMQH